MTSIIRSIIFFSAFILLPYALVPQAGIATGWLDNAATALACPIESIVVGPSIRTIDAGGSTSFEVTVHLNPRYGFTGQVKLWVKNPPSGVSSTPVYVSVGAGDLTAEGTLSITSTCTVKPGTYGLEIKAAAIYPSGPDTFSGHGDATLVVNSPVGDFTISGGGQTPPKIDPGGSAEFNVTGHFTGCFEGPVDLSVDASTLPTGVSVESLDPGTIRAGSPMSTLKLKTTADTPVGRHEITVKGWNASIGTRETTVTLVVEKPPEKFYLSAGPQDPPEIKPGETATYKIFAHNFPDSVYFSIEGALPPGVKDAAIDPTVLPITGTHDWVTLTVETYPTIKDGTYDITVKGKCGAQWDDVVVTLNVGRPPVGEAAGLVVDKSVTPNSAKVGGLVLYTITIRNTGRGTLKDVVVRDGLPVGIGYAKGSTVAEGRSLSDPAGTRTLLWKLANVPGGDTVTLKYKGVVKPNIARGKSTNTVTVTGTDSTGRTLTAKASASIGVSADDLERKGKIKGSVFFDENNNRLKNVDEEGIGGVAVILENGERTTSDEEGLFTFEEIESGEHLVGLDLRKLGKDYYVIGEASRLVSVFAGGTGRTSFTLGRTGPTKEELEAMRKAEEERKRKEEEAKREQEELKKKQEEEKKKNKEEQDKKRGSITGTVFLDGNKNGRLDVGERGIEGITVLLDGSKRAVTDVHGDYRFEKVAFGTHNVSIYVDGRLPSRLTVKKDTKATVVVDAPVYYQADLPVEERTGLTIKIELNSR